METWRTIPDWDCYEVSNTGKIRSKDRKMLDKRIGAYTRKGRIRKLRKDQHGYYHCTISQDGRKKVMKVHRAVAMAFVPNPDNKPCVNHIDNNITNNSPENLEWCTHKENMMWMHTQGRAKRTEAWLRHLHESQEPMRKPVIGINIATGKQIYFKRLNGVAESGFQPSCVSLCCNGKAQKHKGYYWKFASERMKQAWKSSSTT